MNRYTESHHRRLHHHSHRGHHRHYGGGRRAGRGEGRQPRAAFQRRFFSREERIAGLELYLNDLRAEARAVEEKLARLQAAG
ncbi:MAG: hypothetical protein RBU35_07765 [Anaerolineae bacterium]|jgi:hypothetical protein|nr:hypothetical protein [Anaerolineae bacterium]